MALYLAHRVQEAHKLLCAAIQKTVCEQNLRRVTLVSLVLALPLLAVTKLTDPALLLLLLEMPTIIPVA